MAHARFNLANHETVDGADAAPTARPAKWSDFGLRLASAAILAPVAVLALWHGGIAWLLLISATLAGLGMEWAALAQRPGAAWLLPGALLAAMLAAVSLGWPAGLAVLAGATLLLGWRFGWLLAAGAPYAGLGGMALLWLRLHATHGLRYTAFLVAVIWATDIGAYLVGRLAGGKKLAPRISPGKTWSGALGGLLLGGAAGATLGGMTGALPAALLLSLFAQGGDLLESAIKRKLGVKDSGRTIPGHGGLFDRLDGFLLAAPLAVLLVLGAQAGVAPWR